MERFERAAHHELENIKRFISERAEDFQETTGLEIYERRIDLIAYLHLKTTSDINAALEEFQEMYNQIKREESSLPDKLDINIAFDDSAIDELIEQAIETGEAVSSLAFEIAKKLEYGLKLVMDRTGMEDFIINGEAVTDMENYINGLVKKSYREGYDTYWLEDQKKH